MNVSLFRLINGWAGQNAILDWFMVFCAEYLIYCLFLGVLLAVALDYKRWRDMGIVAIGSVITARLGIAELIRRLYYHPRPWILPDTHLLLPKEIEASFPSGHTTMAFALAASVYLYNKKVGTWLYALAALVGFARVFVGVHWPLDIVGGAAVGILTALVCNMLYRKNKHKFGL